MCLLDRVENWEKSSIICVATSHKAPDNPLRKDGRLHVVCGVEYAAQTMAVHYGLLAEERFGQGFLVRLREVRFSTDRLDAGADPLRIVADRLSGNKRGAMYRFVVSAGPTELISGRATVFVGDERPGQ
jgi:predicted hotdog family 3-hydroxylacyl-ACP dehydratase